MIAGLSANYLAALRFAAARRHERDESMGIDVRDLVPVHADFNLDLCRPGPAAILAHLGGQLAPSDRVRFLP